jgi:muramoyltetrapeptide carboxypeptidase
MHRDTAPAPVKAPALKPGNTVAVVAPASPPDPASLDSGVRFLREAGFRVLLGRHILDRQGYLAGSDTDRASDFNSMICNPDVRAIFCSRGGYGSARIAGHIDYQALRNDPKIIIGFSDITLLLAAVWRTCNLITFHGPLTGDAHTSKWSHLHLLHQVTGKAGNRFMWPTPAHSACSPRWIAPPTSSTVTGRLFGGCLSLLVTLPGTPWDLNESSPILFFEDIGEAPYRIDRMLTHLLHAGWFSRSQAVLTGSFKNCVQHCDDPEPTPDTETLVHGFLESVPIPFMTGLPFGHGSHNFTIPFGCLVEAGPEGVVQLENTVS